MTRILALAFALVAATPASAGPPTLTCETRGDIRHCWNERGDTVLTEERSGDYTHGHDNHGHAWTEWRRGDRTYTWPSR
jgi:hypothetical protein